MSNEKLRKSASVDHEQKKGWKAFVLIAATSCKAIPMWFRNKELLTFWQPATPLSQQERAYFLVWTGGNSEYRLPNQNFTYQIARKYTTFFESGIPVGNAVYDCNENRSKNLAQKQVPLRSSNHFFALAQNQGHACLTIIVTLQPTNAIFDS